MTKKSVLKKHTVKANMQVLELTKAGSSMSFKIFANEEKIGTIITGRGSLTWYGRNRRRGKTFSWSEFAE
ncbi:MAG TPA: hypothetical protein VGB17_17725 [Pyrinomonadaceae bacterium]|jgi:hypothetical protein